MLRDVDVQSVQADVQVVLLTVAVPQMVAVQAVAQVAVLGDHAVTDADENVMQLVVVAAVQNAVAVAVLHCVAVHAAVVHAAVVHAALVS